MRLKNSNYVVTRKRLQLERFKNLPSVRKNMAKAIHLSPHTIKDSIVLDGIRGINAVKDSSKIPANVTGGMAVQGYVSEDSYRPTVDLDFCLMWSGSTGQFKEVMYPFVDYMQSKGYQVSFEKKGFTYEFSLNNGNTLLVQHQRRAHNHFERQHDSLQREFDNSRTIFKEDFSYQSLSPEDLAVHKLSRTMIFVHKYGLHLPETRGVEDLRREGDILKDDILARLGNVDPEEVGKLRLIYDCVDIKLLANKVGLNMGYFADVVSDWSKAKGNRDDFYRTLERIV